MRYELRNGRFGDYFFDTRKDLPMGLEQVLYILNNPPLMGNEQAMDELFRRMDENKKRKKG